ncbi:hypothetical protein ACQP0C_21615 [Nocardia sp. CA-129566]|uniref:hypothetical protein n=1 Tax=Nocardia sp. CA-129566 TaxID=3239976 RepID=UPI003D950FE5
MPESRTRDHYQTYWTKILAQPGWAERALNEPTPVELQRLCEVIKTQRLIRRNGRDGT